MVKNLLSLIVVIGLIIIVVVNFMNNNQETTKEKEEVKVEVTPNTASSEATDTAVEQEADAQAVYMAPDFELKTLGGKTVRLSDYVGKKVILNFWATWCPPCKEEVPHMQKIYEEYKDQGVEILAVNVTNQDNGREAVAQFAKNYGLTFEILLDEEGFASQNYQVVTLPTSYMINAEGHLIETIEGPMNEALMRELIKKADS